jgi:hypothetical protein
MTDENTSESSYGEKSPAEYVEAAPTGSSYLCSLYLKRDENMRKEIENYTKNSTPEELLNEMKFLDQLVKSKDYELRLSIFLIEVLISCHKVDICKLAEIVNGIMKKKDNYKHSIYKLRIVKGMADIGGRHYIPLFHYISEILERCMGLTNLVSGNVKFNYDMVKVGSDLLKTVEHRDFVINQSIGILLHHLNTVSANIGFPEFSYFVVKKIKSLKLGDEYRTLLDKFIQKVEAQSEYIGEERKRINASILENKDIHRFEKGVKRMF